MIFRNATEKDVDQINKLEEKMYWNSPKWKVLWKKEAESLFRKMWESYVRIFPEGFIVLEDNEKIIGSMLLTKINSVKTIPYVHNCKDFFDENGKIAYVQCFVLEDLNDKESAKKLYLKSIENSKKIRCSKLIVIIYSSPLEETVIKELGFTIEKTEQSWEIYPNTFVKCKIYSKDME